MSDPFIGEIRMFGFTFAPAYWAMCNGTVLPISQNTALFSLLGTFYGGNGSTTFALPNLQGRAPLNFGQGAGLTNRSLGQSGGAATVTLTSNQLPAHTHAVANTTAGNQSSPASHSFAVAKAQRQTVNLYSSSSNTTMNGSAVAPTGGNQAHNNLPPYLVLNFCIALSGIYPSRG